MTRSFEKLVLSYFQRTRPESKIESFSTTGRLKKIDQFACDGFCIHCNTVFEAAGCSHHFCHCQEARSSSTGEETQRGSSKKVLNQLRRKYIKEESFTVIEMWECEWWRVYKTTTNVKLQIRENFPDRRSLAEHQFREGIKEGTLFGYVQCDIEFPEKLRANFANFTPIFKNTLVSKNDFGDLMKTYAEEEGIMSQPGKMLIFELHITKRSFHYSPAVIVSSTRACYYKIHRYVEYTPRKCFSSFLQSAVDARRQCVKNAKYNVLAETMVLLAKSCYG